MARRFSRRLRKRQSRVRRRNNKTRARGRHRGGMFGRKGAAGRGGGKPISLCRLVSCLSTTQ